MLILVTYDVSLQDVDGPRRLRKIAKACLDYGIRVQYSVFECDVSPEQWAKLQHDLLSLYDPAKDSLRFYKLGKHWRHKVEHHGAKPSIDPFQDTLII